MEEENIMEFENLKKIIASILSVDPNEITMESTFADDLGADSLDLFQIVMGIEETFDIEINAEQVESIITVGEALELLKNTRN
ncbi:MAG: acyl carrier protein [Lachnospiraceae bacterium]